ncbi:MAG: nicotinate-nucleotide--dimethylbenzimidazole phosphoribosyltransferase [Cytophagales bacterium]|nr:nicotinate-nucleotide--dimethylbenzimidazole phosphoribosyltransferase [Cytophagales bacterium]
MRKFYIKPVNNRLEGQLTQKIDFKTKPPGSLGALENLAKKIGMMQGRLNPGLRNPTIVVFAGDHGAAADGISAFPQEVTHQMVFNFLNQGAAINVFCRQHNIGLKVVDAGVNFDFEDAHALIHSKIAKGTQNYLREPAMSPEQCDRAITHGAKIVEKIAEEDSNIIGFGEMGIGNTSSASLLMSKICNLPLEDCVGRGTGLDDDQLDRKIQLLKGAIRLHETNNAFEILRTFGGFEMAMMCGAMLAAAEKEMIILVDGFIATSVFLAANRMEPDIKGYALFCHQSDEQGHEKMLGYLGADPILKMGLRLGEGTGCALAYPIIQSAVAFLNDMASFDAAGVSNKE